MDFSERSLLLTKQVKKHLRENVEPHLDHDERLTYFLNYQWKVKLDRTVIPRDELDLVTFPSANKANVLDAIIGQAVFGREAMMKRDWFRLLYSQNVARLDSLPKEEIQELRQKRTVHSGAGKDSSPPAKVHTTVENNKPLLTPTVSVIRSNIAEDIAALLKKQDEQTTELDKKHEAELNKQNEEKDELIKKHEAELRKRFDTAIEKYPALSGVLCGVQHSFQDRADRSAERKTLIDAIKEYIASIGP